MIKKIIIILSTVIIAVFLVKGWKEWKYQFEYDVEIANNRIFSEVIPLDSSGTFKWVVPKHYWGDFGCIGYLSLVTTTPTKGPSSQYWKDKLSIDFKISAKTLISQNRIVNRLVESKYFSTDRPFDKEARIWESHSDTYSEYGLAGIWLLPGENLEIDIEILTPNLLLAEASPKLMLVREHDYAIFGHLGNLDLYRNLRDIGFIFCILLLIWIAINALKSIPNKPL